MISLNDLKDLRDSYDRKHDARWIGVHRAGRADAVLRKDRTLILPGVGNRMELLTLLSGIRQRGKTSDWHLSVLDYANTLEAAVKHWNPRRILGHSLGGSAGQLLAERWGLACHAVAAPGFYRNTKQRPNEGRIFNILRSDDIALLYPGGRYRRFGLEVRFEPGDGIRPGHSVAAYMRVFDRMSAAMKSATKRKRKGKK